MRRVTCHSGRLQFDEAFDLNAGGPFTHATDDGVPVLERGHMHELLVPAGLSRTAAVVLSLASASAGAFVWCGAELEPYLPALAAAGVALDRVYLLRPRSRSDLHWAAVETLSCPGVGVMIAAPQQLMPVEARRLQLAAERGGGLGLLIRRPDDARVHAARTRWLVHPERGEAFIQRWRLQLVYGHGRPTDYSLILEINRETNPVRAAAVVADRPREATPARTA